jgi:hypothetical protein
MLTFGGVDTFHARADLPPPDEVDETVESLLQPALRHQVACVVLVLYADDSRVGRDIVRRLEREFRRAKIDVMHVLRAHEGRWFAVGRGAVPLPGVPYDASSHPFRAQAVFNGIVVQGSRAELEALLRPLPHAVARTQTALRRAVPSAPGEIVDLVDARVARGSFTDVELARVLLGLGEAGGRDAALTAISPEAATEHTRLWTDAVQRSPDQLVAGPAAVLGVAAWLAGQGALAWCAVVRCRGADPDNSLAGLVAEVLTRAVPPSAWAQVAP